MIETPWDEVAARYDSNKLTSRQLAEVAARLSQAAYRQGYWAALESQEVRQLIYEAECAANVCQSFDHPYTAESVRKSLAALERLRKEAQGD